MALDRQISRFLNALQKQVPGGLKRVSVVLTGDHGAPPMPSYLKRNKTRAGYLDAKSLRQRLNQHLDQVFGPDKLRQWVGGQSKLHFYLDRAVMKEAGVSRVSVEEASQEYLSKLPNVAYVAIKSEIVKGRRDRDCWVSKSLMGTTLGEAATSWSYRVRSLCPRFEA